MTRNLCVVYNGHVWGHREEDAVLIAGDRVSAIGKEADFDGIHAERVDARDGSILPGFIDGHTHLLQSGLAETGWQADLSNCSRGEALERIAERVRDREASDWLVASGWDESRWSPAIGLSRPELDRVSLRVPIVAARVDGHVAVMNSAATERVRRAIKDLSPLVDLEAGEVREEGIEDVLALARPDAAAVADALRAAAAACHRQGVTTAHVMSGWLDPFLLFETASVLRVRLVVHPPVERLLGLADRGIATGDGDDWSRWGGIKLFADGSIGARNAAMSRRYTSGGRGALNLSLGSLVRALAAADRAGLQTLVHAIGDRAIGQVVEAHGKARTDRGLRHRIEHFEFPTREQIEAVGEQGLSVCMQPNFVGNWSGPGSLYEVALGTTRDAESNPFRAVLDAGILLGLGSDGMPLSPLYGIASVLCPHHPGQRMDIEEAVGAYTHGSAKLSSGLPSPGTLAEGSRADLVILDRPLDASSSAAARVAATFVDGERVYAATG